MLKAKGAAAPGATAFRSVRGETEGAAEGLVCTRR